MLAPQLTDADEALHERCLRHVLNIVIAPKLAQDGGAHERPVPASKFAVGFPVIALRPEHERAIAEPLQVVCHIYLHRRVAC